MADSGRTVCGIIKTEDLAVSESELARRLGVPREFIQDDKETADALEEVKKSIAAKYVIAESDVRTENGTVFTDFGEFVSENLCKNLADSKKMIVFAVTLGFGTERCLKKLSLTSPVECFFADAAASAYAEAAADYVTDMLKKQYAPARLRPRFSPGYGDMNISTQVRVFEKLDASRNLGITLTDSFLMIPQKSITAFHGVVLN